VRLYDSTCPETGDVVPECIFCVTNSSAKAAEFMGHALVLDFLNRRMLLAEPDGSIFDPTGELADSTKSIWVRKSVETLPPRQT
jgi:hypothetical protein